MNNFTEGVLSIVMVGLFIWGGISFFSSITDKEDVPPSTQNGVSYSNDGERFCVEPQNPYDDGTGHYAGFEWGQTNHSCGGNSESFIEGCEEYERLEALYLTCF